MDIKKFENDTSKSNIDYSSDWKKNYIFLKGYVSKIKHLPSGFPEKFVQKISMFISKNDEEDGLPYTISLQSKIKKEMIFEIFSGRFGEEKDREIEVIDFFYEFIKIKQKADRILDIGFEVLYYPTKNLYKTASALCLLSSEEKAKQLFDKVCQIIKNKINKEFFNEKN